MARVGKLPEVFFWLQLLPSFMKRAFLKREAKTVPKIFVLLLLDHLLSFLIFLFAFSIILIWRAFYDHGLHKSKLITQPEVLRLGLPPAFHTDSDQISL